MDKLDPALRLQVDTTQPINNCLHAMLAWDYEASLKSVAKDSVLTR